MIRIVGGDITSIKFFADNRSNTVDQWMMQWAISNINDIVATASIHTDLPLAPFTSHNQLGAGTITESFGRSPDLTQIDLMEIRIGGQSIGHTLGFALQLC
jgi:hypothetical protein